MVDCNHIASAHTFPEFATLHRPVGKAVLLSVLPSLDNVADRWLQRHWSVHSRALGAAAEAVRLPASTRPTCYSPIDDQTCQDRVQMVGDADGLAEGPEARIATGRMAASLAEAWGGRHRARVEEASAAPQLQNLLAPCVSLVGASATHVDTYCRCLASGALVHVEVERGRATGQVHATAREDKGPDAGGRAQRCWDRIEGDGDLVDEVRDSKRKKVTTMTRRWERRRQSAGKDRMHQLQRKRRKPLEP